MLLVLVCLMGSCQKIRIDQKLFEFKKENAQWWRITESSGRVTKFISIDTAALEWLAYAMGDCRASIGSSKFYKT